VKSNKELHKPLMLLKEFKYSEVIYLLKKTLLQNPRNLQAIKLLVELYIKLAKYDEALKFIEKSLCIYPEDQELLSTSAHIYEARSNYTKALILYRNALNTNSQNQCFLKSCIGRVLLRLNEDYEALSYLLDAVIEIKNDSSLHNNIAFAANRLGRYDLVLEHYQKAFDLSPNNSQLLKNLIFHSLKDPTKTVSDIKAYSDIYYQKFLSQNTFSLRSISEKRLDLSKTRLRLGFVSADFHKHPVTAYLLPVLERLNREDFEIYLYYNEDFSDSFTERYQTLADKFVSIKEIDDNQAAELIYQDQIDVLFDLSGFTAGERLGIFKIKPAPVQVHHVGFYGSLSLPEIDFIFADQSAIKSEEEKLFVEKIYRLQDSYTHCNLAQLPLATNIVPKTKNGFVTFGSMNSFHKISPELLSIWAEILAQVDNSKLIINSLTLNSKSNKKYVLDFFTSKSIDSSRIDIRASASRDEFLNTYSEIDIALDSFPYGGGTTTLESLMMNVPVITIAGDRWSARQVVFPAIKI
jgi:protein O-GlcNAc transferase